MDERPGDEVVEGIVGEHDRTTVAMEIPQSSHGVAVAGAQDDTALRVVVDVVAADDIRLTPRPNGDPHRVSGDVVVGAHSAAVGAEQVHAVREALDHAVLDRHPVGVDDPHAVGPRGRIPQKGVSGAVERDPVAGQDQPVFGAHQVVAQRRVVVEMIPGLDVLVGQDEGVTLGPHGDTPAEHVHRPHTGFGIERLHHLDIVERVAARGGEEAGIVGIQHVGLVIHAGRALEVGRQVVDQLDGRPRGARLVVPDQGDAQPIEIRRHRHLEDIGIQVADGPGVEDLLVRLVPPQQFGGLADVQHSVAVGVVGAVVPEIGGRLDQQGLVRARRHLPVAQQIELLAQQTDRPRDHRGRHRGAGDVAVGIVREGGPDQVAG